jgi:hypothetical protein
MGQNAKSSFERSLTEARADDVRGDFAAPTGRGGISCRRAHPSFDKIEFHAAITFLSDNRRILDEKA